MISAKTSNDLFNKVRSKFANIQLGDSMGGVTANPGDAVFFDFEFSENSDEFGRVSISLADGETMKVFYNKGLVEKLEDENKTDWYSFLKELKDFAVTHQIGFDVRDITKPNLSQQDFKNLANNNDTLNTDGMSEELNRITKLAGLSEGLTGTSRSSFENLDKTRIIIRHSKPVAEEVPGARTRHINTLYIENSEGERFKYPIVHLAGARAMARHVANGGLPHDEFGEHIIKMSEQIAQLNSFSRYVTTKDQLNDSAGDIIEKAKMKLESMRQYVRNLSKQSHYEQAKTGFQPSTLAELDDATKQSLQDKFTLKHFDEKVDQVLPLINSIMSEYDDEKPLSKKDVEIPAPVDGGDETLKFLNSGQPLVLKKNPSADMLTFRSEFKQKKDMLRTVLMDIATRILPTTPETDTIANFASAMANDLAKVGDAFGDVSSNTFNRDLKIAEKLGIRYVQDIAKMRKDPNYADTVRKDPQDVKAKVDRQGKAKVNVEDTVIEGWADNITEQKPYVSMYKGDDNKMVYDVLDQEGESAFKSDDYKIATDYLKKNFNQLSGREPAMDSVNENNEAMIIDGKQVNPSSIEYDMQDYGDVIAPISAAKFMDGTDLTDDQMADLEASEAYITWVRNDYDERAMSMADDVNMEGNEFAQAVQKAKAAGMKPGDKFEVGGKEYTLKDAIEQAGLQLETFFGEDESVAELDDKQRTASSLKYSADPRVAYFDKMMKRYGPKLMELIIDHSHIISTDEKKGEEKLKKYGQTEIDFMNRFNHLDGVEEDLTYMLMTAVEKGEEGLIDFFYDRVEQAKKAGNFSKTSRIPDPDEYDESVSEDAGLTDQQKQGLQAIHNKFKGRKTASGGSLPYEYLNYQIEPELYSDQIDAQEEQKVSDAFGLESIDDVQRAMDDGEIEGDFPDDIEKYIPVTMSVWAAVDKVLGKANDQQIQAAMNYLSSIDESVEDTELTAIKKLAGI